MRHKHILILTISFFLIGFVKISAQAKTIAYCDSLIRVGVEAILSEKDYLKGVEVLEEARILAEQKEWYRQQFLAINNIGIMHHMMFDYGEALNYYLEAYTISLKHLEDQQTMIVLNNIAILYSKEKNYDKAMEYFKRAYDIAKKNDDLIKVGFYGINLGTVCNFTNQLDLAESYINEALLHLTDYSNKTLEAKAVQVETIYLKQDYEKTIEECHKLILEAGNSKNSDVRIELTYLLAKAYLAKNDISNALFYANKSLEDNQNMDIKAEIYNTISDITYQNGSYHLSLLYKDSILYMHDSLNQIRNGRLFENSKVKFELQNYQHELSLKEAQLESNKKIFFAILGIIVIALIFVFSWLHNKTVKQKQKKKIEEDRRKIVELELENEKNENLLLENQLHEKETIALLEQERLKNEIELRNRQLSAKALYLSAHDRVMEELITYLSKYPDLAKDETFSKHLKTLKSQLNSEKEWESFTTHFEEVNQGILSNLKQKHTSLNTNDIRFISYIYMNLSTKEIASMLNITLEACRKRKERISKKMSLEGENSLYDYLFSYRL